MKVYTDSDFAGDIEDRKSTLGYVVLWKGGAVAWLSKKQNVVALSTTEAEYMAATKDDDAEMTQQEEGEGKP
ncbi:hypothetical protein E3N88_46268 [Mikania micrantha]|uniref:Reverse transcriptase Ty1/copia-type domain-containing protein n=1 Tax=Mikania micrantha TaxID=192012 RepID=A0A5N6L6T8_9ASTR|nr:hypothetical protein E3N88_46268 [Mikania micrantha]